MPHFPLTLIVCNSYIKYNYKYTQISTFIDILCHVSRLIKPSINKFSPYKLVNIIYIRLKYTRERKMRYE